MISKIKNKLTKPNRPGKTLSNQCLKMKTKEKQTNDVLPVGIYWTKTE